MDATEKVISCDENILSNKGNEQIIQRIQLTEREGSTYKMTSTIKKKKIWKEMKPSVYERTKWPKFGNVAGQKRGQIEPGIVVVATEDTHIIDRSKNIEMDLGDKIKETIKNKRQFIIKEIQEKRDKQRRERLEKLAGETNKNKRINRRRYNEATIKVTNIPFGYTANKIAEMFSKVGEVIRVTITNRRVVFVQFAQSAHCHEAVDMFHDTKLNNCILDVEDLSLQNNN